jgi:hypothetical protein
VVQGSAAIVGLGVHLSPSIEEHLEAGSLAIFSGPVEGALAVLGASVQRCTLNRGDGVRGHD